VIREDLLQLSAGKVTGVEKIVTIGKFSQSMAPTHGLHVRGQVSWISFFAAKQVSTAQLPPTAKNEILKS
jgi:hypothetical protein